MLTKGITMLALRVLAILVGASVSIYVIVSKGDTKLIDLAGEDALALGACSLAYLVMLWGMLSRPIQKPESGRDGFFNSVPPLLGTVICTSYLVWASGGAGYLILPLAIVVVAVASVLGRYAFRAIRAKTAQ